MLNISRTLTHEQRQFDPEEVAQWEAAAEEVTRRLDAKVQRDRADKAARAPSNAAKVFYLRQMAEGLSAAAAPALACKSGCSHCCYMPVVMGEAEAAQIARATGAKMRKSGFTFSAEGKPELSGQACTFLKGGKCSIYEHRPFACRVYFVVHRDNSRCKITPGQPLVAPQIDANAYHLAYARAFGESIVRTMADIRDFFPHGLVKR